MLKKTCLISLMLSLILCFTTLSFSQEASKDLVGKVSPVGIQITEKHTLHLNMSIEQVLKIMHNLNLKVYEKGPILINWNMGYCSFVDNDSNIIKLTWNKRKVKKIFFSQKSSIANAQKNIKQICVNHKTFGPRRDIGQFLDVVYYNCTQKRLCVLIEFDLNKRKFLTDCYKQAFSK